MAGLVEKDIFARFIFDRVGLDRIYFRDHQQPADDRISGFVVTGGGDHGRGDFPTKIFLSLRLPGRSDQRVLCSPGPAGPAE